MLGDSLLEKTRFEGWNWGHPINFGCLLFDTLHFSNCTFYLHLMWYLLPDMWVEGVVGSNGNKTDSAFNLAEVEVEAHLGNLIT